MIKSEKKRVARSPQYIFMVIAIVTVLTASFVISYVCLTGGGRASSDPESLGVADPIWNNTLSCAYNSCNASACVRSGSLFKISNGSVDAEFDINEPYYSRLYGTESGKLLLYSLPTPYTVSDGRLFMLEENDISAPMNGPYNASVLSSGTMSADGLENEFSVLKSYTLDSKSDISDWTMILKGCELSLDDGCAKVTVSSSDTHYFGSGKVSADLSSLGDKDIGCVRLKLKGSGVSMIEVNYSATFENTRLQGSASGTAILQDGWTYVTIPIEDGDFTGELYSLYFKLTAEDGAEFYVESVEIGYIGRYGSDLICDTEYSAYYDRCCFSSSVTAPGGFTAESIYTETVIAAESLLKIELYVDGESVFYPVSSFSSEKADCVTLYYANGETLSFIPIPNVPLLGIEFILEETGRLDMRLNYDPFSLTVPGKKLTMTCRLLHSGANEAHDFISPVKEEAVLIPSTNVITYGGKFEGYDSSSGRYLFTFLPSSEFLAVSLVSQESRYVYLEFEGFEGDLSVENSSGDKLPLIIGKDNAVIGIYLNAAEPLSFTVRASPTEYASPYVPENISYTDSVGRPVDVKLVSAFYRCSGEVYAETEYKGMTEDGASEVRVSTTRFVQDDVDMVFYELDMSFLKTVAMRDMSESLYLLTLKSEEDGTVCYTDVSDGFISRVASDIRGDDSVFTLGSIFPYIGTLSGGRKINAAVIRSFSATSGITPLPSALHAGYTDGKLFLSATGDLLKNDSSVFGLGDHVLLSAVLASAETDNAEKFLSTLRTDYGNGYLATADKGELISVSPVPAFRVNGKGYVSFAVRGGKGDLPVKAEGFTSYVLPDIQVNGADYTPQNYDVYIDDDGTFGFVFIVPVNSETVVYSPQQAN